MPRDREPDFISDYERLAAVLEEMGSTMSPITASKLNFKRGSPMTLELTIKQLELQAECLEAEADVLKAENDVIYERYKEQIERTIVAAVGEAPQGKRYTLFGSENSPFREYYGRRDRLLRFIVGEIKRTDTFPSDAMVRDFLRGPEES